MLIRVGFGVNFEFSKFLCLIGFGLFLLEDLNFVWYFIYLLWLEYIMDCNIFGWVLESFVSF